MFGQKFCKNICKFYSHLKFVKATRNLMDTSHIKDTKLLDGKTHNVWAKVLKNICKFYSHLKFVKATPNLMDTSHIKWTHKRHKSFGPKKSKCLGISFEEYLQILLAFKFFLNHTKLNGHKPHKVDT